MKRVISAMLIVSLMTCRGGRITRVSFAAVGDNLIHSSIYKGAAVGADFDFSPVYSGVSGIISDADVSFVNQETMLGSGHYSGYPKFCSPYQVGAALYSAGFDVVNIANNHSLDLGEEGFLFTRDYLESLGFTVVGDGDVEIVEKNGIKIAFLAFTYATNYGVSPAVSRIDESNIRAQMAIARERADVIIVSAHFGVEYDTPVYIGRIEPTVSQTETAKLLCSLGADVIIGTHPHVLETAEWIEAGGHKAFCAYSLGNFVSNMRYDKTVLGGILTFDIVKSPLGVKIVSPKVIPTVCHYGKDHKGHTVYTLEEYTNALAALHGTSVNGNERKFCKESLIEIYESNIDGQFRPRNYK
ncbi:MAG: CapA family protein [Clostridiales bacterium]|nr:CapA family protein [Clostridiales bacterium]